MIQFNLLPDVKLQFVRAQRMKRLVTLGSIAVSVVSLVALGFMLFTVKVVQGKSLSDLNKDIASSSQQLKDVPDLNKILTVQNQLNTLTGMHDSKIAAQRIFSYVNQVTPPTAAISSLSVDFDAKTMSIGGQAPSLDVINVYADTLKATKFTVDGQTKAAFSDVVLSSFSRDKDRASYTLTLNYDETIFSNTQDVKLTIPTGAESTTTNVFQESGN